MKKLKVNTPSTAEDVKEAYKNNCDKKERERLLAIVMGQTGIMPCLQVLTRVN